jgi:hypothetical protein
MTPNDLLNALIFQAQLQMKFGSGQDSDISVNPGVVSQGLYYGSPNDSDADPFGVSYYGQDDPSSGSDSQSLISKVLSQLRGPQNFSSSTIGKQMPGANNPALTLYGR